MKRFLKLYRQLLIANLGRTLAHRVDFWNSLFASLLWGGFSIAAIYTITSKSTIVAGWTKGEVVLLALTYAIIVGIFHTFFSRNFPTAATIIHRGELDGLLLKPGYGLILLIGSEINYANTIRPLVTLPIIYLVVRMYDIHVTLLSVLGFSVLTVAGAAILVSIHILFLVILLSHSYLSNLMDFGSLLVSASRYPMGSLKYAPVYASLLFLPVMAAINVPTLVLINKATVLEVLLFIGGATLLTATSLILWKRSIVYYTGASG